MRAMVCRLVKTDRNYGTGWYLYICCAGFGNILCVSAQYGLKMNVVSVDYLFKNLNIMLRFEGSYDSALPEVHLCDADTLCC